MVGKTLSNLATSVTRTYPTTSLYNLLAKKQAVKEFAKELSQYNAPTRRTLDPTLSAPFVNSPNVTAFQPTLNGIQSILKKQEEKIKELVDGLKNSADPYNDPRRSPEDHSWNLRNNCEAFKKQMKNYSVTARTELENYFTTLETNAGAANVTAVRALRDHTLNQFDESYKGFTGLMDRQIGDPAGTTEDQRKGMLRVGLDSVKNHHVDSGTINLLKKMEVDLRSEKFRTMIDGSGENPLEVIPEAMKMYLETDHAKLDSRALIDTKIKKDESKEGSYIVKYGLAKAALDEIRFTGDKALESANAVAKFFGIPKPFEEGKFTKDVDEDALDAVKAIKGGKSDPNFKIKYDQELYKSQDILARIQNGDNELDILFGLIRGTLYAKNQPDRLFIAHAVDEDGHTIKAKMDATNMKEEMKVIIEHYDNEKKKPGVTDEKKNLLDQQCKKDLATCADKYRNGPYTDKEGKEQSVGIKDTPVKLPEKTGYPPSDVSPHLIRDLHRKAREKIMDRRQNAFDKVAVEMEKNIRNDLAKVQATRPAITFGQS